MPSHLSMQMTLEEIEEKRSRKQFQAEIHVDHRRCRQRRLVLLGQLALASERRRVHSLRQIHTDITKKVNASFLLFQVATAGASSTSTRGDPSYS